MDKPWKPDWVVITIWIVIVTGCVAIWYNIAKPIVDFLK